MILDSTQNILQSCQKLFWIPLKIFNSHVRNDRFGVIIHIVWLYLESKTLLKLFYGHVRNDGFGVIIKYFGKPSGQFLAQNCQNWLKIGSQNC